MALTYEKVISVISQPPDMRKDFEVNNLLSWFRKKSDLFRNLKTELLFDIIKHLQLEKKKRDDIVIKQGDKGDCMYILLRGQVTIFILYAAKVESEEDKPQQPLVQIKAGESIRTQLGTFVCSLGAGATFGEVALFSDDCIRTASIISDDNSDLIVVDRELYNRSVKSVLHKEFEDKSNFIATSPFFHNWPPKYKKQLAMALVKESVPYENMLVRQGDPVSGIFFILSGEVKLLADPTQHESQYQKFGPFEEVKPPPEDEFNEVNELLKQMSVKGHRPDEPELPKYRRKSRRNVLELCLLGMNECVGDMEVLMDMETYMQTAICTQRTEVLLLEMKHFERLLVKRNPRTIDNMKAALELKLTSRISTHVARQVPLLKILSDKVLEYLEQREQANIARAKAKDSKNGKHHGTKKASYNGFIPSKGPLIDMHGPGTVFHRIRKRQQNKAKQQARFAGGAGQGSPSASRAHPEGGGCGGDHRAVPLEELEPAMIDPVLDNLERRMREWLVNEKGTRGKIQPKYQVYDMQSGLRQRQTSASTASTISRPVAITSNKGVTKASVQHGASKVTVAASVEDRRTKDSVTDGGSSGDEDGSYRPGGQQPNEVYNGHAFV